MSYILRPRTRRSQPQGPVDIDWSNAITKQLLFAAIPIAGNFFDVVTRTWGTPGGFVAAKKVLARAGGYTSQPYAQVLAADGSTTAGYLWPVSDTLRGATAGPNVTLLALAAFNQQVDGHGYATHSNIEAISLGDGVGLGVDSFKFSGRGLIAKIGYNGSIGAVSGGTGIGNPFDKRLHFFGYANDANGVEWFYQRTSNTNTALSFGTTRTNRRACVLGASASGSDTETKEANVALALIWDRKLSLAEYQALYDNPWLVFRPQQRRVYVSAAVAGSVLSAAGDSTATFVGAPLAKGVLSAAGDASVTFTGKALGSGVLSAAGDASGIFVGKTLAAAVLAAAGDATCTWVAPSGLASDRRIVYIGARAFSGAGAAGNRSAAYGARNFTVRMT